VHGTPSTPVVAVPCEAGALHVCARLRAEVPGGPRGELHLDGAPAGELAELHPAGEACGCDAASPVLVPLGSTATALPGPDGAPVTAVDVERVVFRSEEHTSELQSRENLVCRLLLEQKKKR